MADRPPALVVENLAVRYGQAEPVFRDLSLTVAAGELVSILGANGAGKSTLMKSLAGLLKPVSGQILLNDQEITSMPAFDRVKRGLVLGLEGHRVINSLSVLDNLRLAVAYGGRGRSRRETAELLSATRDTYPVLAQRWTQPAGSLSGGEQQMLVLARLLIVQRRVVLVDEPSLGLAPIFVREVYEALARAQRDGCAVLVVEQNVAAARRWSTRQFVLHGGRLEAAATGDGFSRKDISRAYLRNDGSASA
jgi:branched-chain amino acid transport system ATP-binding protein